MTCSRCTGLMIREPMARHHDDRQCHGWWWSCVCCGNKEDRRILLNRAEHAYEKLQTAREWSRLTTWLDRQTPVSTTL